MGQRSKYTFPLPGRKHGASSKTKPKSDVSPAPTPMSKAQRLLGAGGINIDSANMSDTASMASWRSGGESVGMSVSISDTSVEDQFDEDSLIDPMPPRRLYNKASSTVLGNRYASAEEESTYSMSTRQLRHEASSSTLRSYYDKNKSPLLVSQQTSASSARDMALRKGTTPVVRSPLLQQVSSYSSSTTTGQQYHDSAPEPTVRMHYDRSKKKPMRLDLSKLFPKPKKEPSNLFSPQRMTASPSNLSLASTVSKASTSTSQEATWRRPVKDSLSHLYDHYESMPARGPNGRFEEPIEEELEEELREEELEAELSVEEDMSALQQFPSPPKSNNSGSMAELPNSPETVPIFKEPSTWSNGRPESYGPSPWETGSMASFSSHNTRNSRHTMNSIFSNSDLQQNSILSLSSDDESGDELVQLPQTPDVPSRNSQSFRSTSSLGRKDSVQSTSTLRTSTSTATISSLPKRSDSVLSTSSTSTVSPEEMMNGSRPQRTPWRTSKKHTSNLLTIPEPTRINPRISGPWNPPNLDNESPRNRDSKASTRRLSVSTANSASTRDSSPSSPASKRFMAVTQQEEALLEALRNKRAMMRENILQGYRKDGPLDEETTTEASTIDSAKPMTGKVYKAERLERPQININDRIHKLGIQKPLPPPPPRKHPQRAIDTATRGRRGRPSRAEESVIPDLGPEPAEFSPDLSDFLTHGSDDESTPRSSWMAGSRESSTTSIPPPRRAPEHALPLTPPSAARLSAVGAAGGFQSHSARKQSPTVNVRLAEDESALHRRGLERDPLEFLDEIMP